MPTPFERAQPWSLFQKGQKWTSLIFTTSRRCIYKNAISQRPTPDMIQYDSSNNTVIFNQYAVSSIKQMDI